MTKTERTKALILEKAAPVFNTLGYASTSLSDLEQATGLSKGSIYGNFENKDAVAVAVYNYQVDRLNQRFHEQLAPQKSMPGKLKALTDFYRKHWEEIALRGGCPLLNASVEADDSQPALREHVRKSVHNWAAMLSRVIEKGIELGEFKKGQEPMEIAYTIITLLEGGMMLSKIMNKQHHMNRALDQIDLLITNITT